MAESLDILRKIRHIELKTRQLVEAAFAGSYHSVFKGRGMNFEEVRQYAPGDEIRAIDWNVTARSGEAYVKKFTEERDLTVMLLVDISASGLFGSVELSKRELAAEVAALLAFSAIRNNDKVGLLLFTGDVELFIPPRKGRAHALRIIREVLFFEPQGRQTNLAHALDYMNRVVRRRCICFLISDFQDENYERPLGITAQRHDMVALPVMDPAEFELPDAGVLLVEDAETGELLELNTRNKSVRKHLAEAALENFEATSKTLVKMGIDVVPLRTDADYLPVLRTFFDQRERRRARE